MKVFRDVVGEHCTRLQKLDLSGNQLHRAESDTKQLIEQLSRSCTFLKELSLSNNNISSQTFLEVLPEQVGPSEQQLFANLESLSVSYSDADDKIEQCTESLRRLKLLPSLLKLNSAYFRESLF